MGGDTELLASSQKIASLACASRKGRNRLLRFGFLSSSGRLRHSSKLHRNAEDRARHACATLSRGTCSLRDFAVCFLHNGSDGMSMRKYIHSVSDGLRRQVGNDLVGWDISSPITMIL